MTAKREKPVCRSCGSEDILADAYVEWDNQNQTWTVQNVFDKGGFCNRCDGECKYDWVDADAETTPDLDSVA